MIEYFQKLKKATGATINLEKIKLLPINTDKTNYMQNQLPNIATLEQHQYLEILGVYFSENLKETIILDWKKNLEKMEKHIQKLSPRKPSLLGKAILVNTITLAKTTYLSNIFSIPENQIKQIHKYIFAYLWQNKTAQPISRKTLFLPKQQGGLNIKEPEAHNMSMGFKHLLNLKQKEKKAPWMHIAIY